MELELYTFQYWDDVKRAFREEGRYMPLWRKSRERMVEEDGDDDVWERLFAPAYRWMMEEMELAGIPRPRKKGVTPLWAWARWVDARDRNRICPDRRCCGFRGYYEGLDLIHLRVDASRVLLTDFDRYHHVLNQWPCEPWEACTWSEEQQNEWYERHDDDSLEELRRQWHDSVIVRPDAIPDRWIQACLWSIGPDDVIDVKRFGSSRFIRFAPK